MVPTIGRIVWYYPGEGSNIVAGSSKFVGAMVQEVYDDSTVSVTGVDMDGDSFCTEEVSLFNPDHPGLDPDIGGYATWMPYQVAQAEKDNG